MYTRLKMGSVAGPGARGKQFPGAGAAWPVPMAFSLQQFTRNLGSRVSIRPLALPKAEYNINRLRFTRKK